MDGTTPGAAVQCSVRGGGITLYSGLLILSEPKRFILYTAPNSDSCSQLLSAKTQVAVYSPAYILPCPLQYPMATPTLTRVTPHPHQYPGVRLVRAARLATAMENMITAAQRDTDPAFILSHIFCIIALLCFG